MIAYSATESTFSTRTMPCASSTSRIGSPFRVRREDARRAQPSCTAIPHGTPTYSAIAEWPDGSPYASSVDVIVSCTAECQHRLTLVTRQEGGEGGLSNADGGCTDERVDVKRGHVPACRPPTRRRIVLQHDESAPPGADAMSDSSCAHSMLIPGSSPSTAATL